MIKILIFLVFSIGSMAHSIKVGDMKERLFRNISPAGTHPGIVVASPSKHDPDYWYHWVRDAALVMDVVLDLYEAESDANKRGEMFQMMMNYTWRVKIHQETHTLTGLGEPKFYVNSAAYNEAWGRPQNDGPPLRALTLIRFANMLLDNGEEELVRNLFYRSEIPANTVIKRDLEYVAHHWQAPSFDLWEELKGDHFYTRISQYASLKRGAALSRRLGDKGAAKFYESQAKSIKNLMDDFIHRDQNRYLATINFVEGLNTKSSGHDMSIILAALHVEEDSPIALDKEQLLNSAVMMIESFDRGYSINQYRRGVAAPALGRYPEDFYWGGNPWVLTTAAMAEYFFKLHKLFIKKGSFKIHKGNQRFFKYLIGDISTRNHPGLITANTATFNLVTNRLWQEGVRFLNRVETHKNPNNEYSEQIDKYTGFMSSAHNLTWSYAGIITALLNEPKK